MIKHIAAACKELEGRKHATMEISIVALASLTFVFIAYAMLGGETTHIGITTLLELTGIAILTTLLAVVAIVIIKAILNKVKASPTYNKGFTLVEMIVVIVIIAILIAAITPAALGVINRANRSADEADARNVLTVAALVVLSHGGVPAQTGDNNFQEQMENELTGGNFTAGSLFTIHFKDNFPVSVVLTTNARTTGGVTVGVQPLPTGTNVTTRTFTAP
jgi:prepilin-type N-terminal cleavage/methylation domain-containing protein